MSKKTLIVLVNILFIMATVYTIDYGLMDIDDTLNDDAGYVYGNFELVTYEGALIPSSATIGVVIENVDTEDDHSFILKNKKDMLQVMKLEPGNYKITQVEYLSKGSFNSYITKKKEPFDVNFKWYNSEFTVKSNTALYLGDFEGMTYNSVSKSTGTLYSNSQSYTNYQIKSPAEGFSKATDDLKMLYPAFDSISLDFVSNIKTLEDRGFINIKNIMTPEDYSVFLERINKEKNDFESSLSEEGQNLFNSLSPEQRAQIQELMEAANNSAE